MIKCVNSRVIKRADDIADLAALANELFPDVPRLPRDWQRSMRDHADDLRLTVALVEGRPRGYLQTIRDVSHGLAG